MFWSKPLLYASAPLSFRTTWKSRRSSPSARSPETLKKRIVNRAHELEIPVDPKSVKVIRGRGSIRMTCDYTEPLDFYVYQRNWDFHLVVDEPVFIW